MICCNSQIALNLLLLLFRFKRFPTSKMPSQQQQHNQHNQQQQKEAPSSAPPPATPPPSARLTLPTSHSAIHFRNLASSNQRRRRRSRRSRRGQRRASPATASKVSSSINTSPSSSLASGANSTSNVASSQAPQASARSSQVVAQTHIQPRNPINTTEQSNGTNGNSQTATNSSKTPSANDDQSDYKLLLSPLFSAMTKITEHLFLTGVGGMTRENFRKNHIDFVVNITAEAPFWEDVESMRLPLEDDVSENVMPYLDMAVDRINEAIEKRQSHVLVHCVAGVSRSATIVIAYLMKYRRMDLRSAFNFCYALRPVVRPNNGFMIQLINYEQHLFGKNSVAMVEADVDGTMVSVPNFFIEEHPRLVLLEVLRARELEKKSSKSVVTANSSKT